MLRSYGDCASEDAYAAAKLMVSLHEQGIGFAPAVDGLAVLHQAAWDLCARIADEDEDWDYEFSGYLRNDPSVSVTAEHWFDEQTCTNGLYVSVSREGAFFISMSTEGYARDQFDNDQGALLVSLSAEREENLVKFLTLIRFIGDEIEISDGNGDSSAEVANGSH